MQLVPVIACDASEADFNTWARAQFGPNLGSKVPAVYTTVQQPTPLCSSRHATGPTSQWWVAAMRSAGDAAIRCRTRELLAAAQKLGSNSWWYHFTATPTYSVNMGQLQYVK